MNSIFQFLARNEKALFITLFILTALLCMVLPAIVIPKLNPLSQVIIP